MTDLLNDVTFLQVISGFFILVIAWMMFEYYKVSETLQLSANVNSELDERIEKLDTEKKYLLGRVNLFKEANDALEKINEELKNDNKNLNLQIKKLNCQLNTIKSGSGPVTKTTPVS